ncbi:MAG: electron transport complex subunit RsxC [Bacillota bacterium]
MDNEIKCKLKKFPIGGVHLPEEKLLTNDRPIEEMPPPEKVVIPLKQHIGVPGDLIVEEGQYVKRGQQLTKNSEDHFSAQIHASISGTITAIEKRDTMFGDSKVECVVIERENEGTDDINYKKEIIAGDTDESPGAVRKIVERAGIAGMGGAGFPTHIKLNPPAEKEIDTVLINGAECEPYLTVDDRLMQEEAENIFRGLELIRKTVGAKEGFVACEVNKPEALKQLNKEAPNWDKIDAVPLDTRYPHGAEKHLIKAVLDREVPLRGLPMDVKVVVNNVQTAIAIARAVKSGYPLIKRVVTVSGRGVSSPANVMVPLGTRIKDLIDYCGGTISQDFIPVMGGPMTGYRIDDLDIPVIKTTTGVVVLNEKEYEESETRVCIRCGKCVNVCPMYLTPNRLCDYINNEMYSEAAEIGLEDCIECGACAFVCPSKRPLLRWLRKGKAKTAQKK